MKFLLFLAVIAPACNSTSDWRPVLQPELYPGLHKGRYPSEPNFSSLPSLVAQSYQQPALPHTSGGQCENYKVGFTQDLYFQYIQYKMSLPELKEFTLCYWSKFTNHSNDHPIFSYAVDGQPRAIVSWISNTDRSSYISMAVEGHTFYRLNYPLRLNRWYHTCQSWNGRTGEWQIWVNAERVGRGFHNRLVDHTIPSGGIAITGQEQTQYGGGFSEGAEAPKGAGGMLGEITMLQLYKVALTAGKAHRDHKHHHAHKFDHDGMPITTTPRPPTPPRPMTPTHPLLTGGQLNPNIALTIASGQSQPSQLIPGQTFDAQLLNGQFLNSFVPPQFTNPPEQMIGVPQQLANPRMMNAPDSRAPQQFIPQDPPLPPYPPFPIPQQPQQQQQQQPFEFLPQTPQFSNSPLPSSGLVHPSLINPVNVQYIDTQLETHQLFKRDSKKDAEHEGANKNTKKKSALKENGTVTSDRQQLTIDPVATVEDTSVKTQTKRELVLHGDTLVDTNSFDQILLDGLAGIGQNQPVLQMQKQYDEREPAEAEVTAVMNVCTGCDEEPFDKALVFGWRSVPKKLYSGAFYTPAIPQCKAF